jgi:hypothetical protein
MLSGIACGIAQAMGLHSDGSSFDLPLLETEMRRRVWWALCQLDNRISEDCGLENHLPVTISTELPQHLNDTDLSNTSNQTGSFLSKFTEMTLSLVKMEMTSLVLRIKRPQSAHTSLRRQEIESMAILQISRYEDIYLPLFERSSPLHTLGHAGTRLLIAKIRRIMKEETRHYSPLDRNGLDDVLFPYNTEVLEITYQFPEDFQQYGWYFHCKYTQW